MAGTEDTEDTNALDVTVVGAIAMFHLTGWLDASDSYRVVKRNPRFWVKLGQACLIRADDLVTSIALEEGVDGLG